MVSAVWLHHPTMDLLDFKQRALERVDNQAAAAIQRARKLLEVFEVCFKNYGKPMTAKDPQVNPNSPDYHVDKGMLHAIVQETADPSSKVVGYLPQGTTVLIAEEVGVKARLVKPLAGWCNLRSREGFVILGVARREPQDLVFPPNSWHTRLAEAILKNDSEEFQSVLEAALATPHAQAQANASAGGGGGGGGVGANGNGGGKAARAAGAAVLAAPGAATTTAGSASGGLPFFVDARDAAGMTLLHYASIHGRLEPMRLLLERGADPNMRMRTDDLISRGKEVRACVCVSAGACARMCVRVCVRATWVRTRGCACVAFAAVVVAAAAAGAPSR